MEYVVYIGLFAPLLGFLILMTFANRVGRVETGIIASGLFLSRFFVF